MNFYTIPKNLSELDHFRSNPMVQFKEETVGGLDVVIPCYMIADADFWKQPFALELRGHVFRKDTGELISAALPKFFNVGENEYTQRHDLPWRTATSIADKRDGSMITFVVIDCHVYAKTKKSFYSDVAIEAQKYLDNTVLGNELAEYVHACFKLGKTPLSPVCEFWHPEWQIVLNYGDEPRMDLLGLRNMDTGAWTPTTDNVENCHTTLANLEYVQETLEGVEGFVIQFEDGRVVKAKTTWYLQQHRVRTDLRERDVAELAAMEKLDDVKSIVSAAGLDLSLIESIEKRVAVIISSVSNSVKEIVAEAHRAQLPTAKEVAQTYKDSPWFGMIMREWRGQEVDYTEYFLKNHLKSFSLKCVYNEKF